jgi:hypothetical protein
VNVFRFPLSFSLLVGIEVWDRSGICDAAVLDVAINLVNCDTVVDGYMAAPNAEGHAWLDRRTHECFSAAVDLVLNEGVVL